MAYVRLLSSAVDPDEVDHLRKVFAEDLRPVFKRVSGCRDIELLVATEQNAGGLVDGYIVAHWDTPEDIERAYERDEVREAAMRFRGLLRQEPVIRLYQVID